MKDLKRRLYKIWLNYLMHHPITAAKYWHRQNTGRRLNLKHPKDLNEKINWLKFYGDTSDWPMLADKWAVRSYVRDRGWEDILVTNYGHWQDAAEIDFDTLTYPCVIKTNNASGTNLFLKTRPQKVEEDVIRKELDQWLHQNYSDLYAEPHYGKINPCLIAEEMLFEDQPISNTLIDYKVFCFNGEVECIWVCYNRSSDHVDVATYDIDWNYHEEYSVFTHHYGKGDWNGLLPKPHNLDRMLMAASSLSKGHPQVRIDFYEVKCHLYFGEITMTGQGGYSPFFTHDFLLQLGAKCHLPID